MSKLYVLKIGILALVISYILVVVAFYSVERENALFLLGGMFLMILGELCKKFWRGFFSTIWIVLEKGVFLLVVLIFCGILLGQKSVLPEERDDLSYILVLGCGLERGQITEILQNRLDKALEMSQIYSVPIVVSGGGNGEKSFNEALLMKEYLRSKKKSIEVLVETSAKDTWENFSYSFRMMGKGESALVVSSNFHIFRCKWIISDMRENMYFVGASTTGWLAPYYWMREVVAIVRHLALGGFCSLI